MRNAECGIIYNKPQVNPNFFISLYIILHSAFRIPHSAFRIPHSAFRIPHSAFRIPHSAFRIHYFLSRKKLSA
jgi:hypothetical protein